MPKILLSMKEKEEYDSSLDNIARKVVLDNIKEEIKNIRFIKIFGLKSLIRIIIKLNP